MQINIPFLLAAISVSSGALATSMERDSVPLVGYGDTSSSDPKALVDDAVKQVGGLALGQVKGTVQGYLGEVGTGVKTAKQLGAFLPTGALPPLPAAGGAGLPIKRDSHGNPVDSVVQTDSINYGDSPISQIEDTLAEAAQSIPVLGQTSKSDLPLTKRQVEILGQALAGAGAGSGLPLTKKPIDLKRQTEIITEALGDVFGDHDGDVQELPHGADGHSFIPTRRALDALKPADALSASAQLIQEGKAALAALEEYIQDAPETIEAFVSNTVKGLKEGAAITKERLAFGLKLTQESLGGSLIPSAKRDLDGLNPTDALAAPAQLIQQGKEALASLEKYIQDAPETIEAFVANTVKSLKEGAAITEERLAYGIKLTQEQLGAVGKRDTVLPAFSLLPGSGPEAVALKNKLQALTGKGTQQGLNSPTGASTDGAQAGTNPLGSLKRMEKVKRSV